MNRIIQKTKNEMPYCSRRTIKGGFTLVELLVVISIIALLLSILMPSLGKARESARNIVCKSNLSKLALATTGYSSDNSGRFPPVWMYKPNQKAPGGDWNPAKPFWWFWPQIMNSFLGDNYELARCSNGYKSLHPDQGNYGFNLSVVGNGSDEYPAYKYSDVRRPSDVILMCDSGTFYAALAMLKNPRIVCEYIPGYSLNSSTWMINRWDAGFVKNDAIKGRHPNKTVNMGFVDGHTGTLPVKVLIDDKFWRAK